MARNLRNSLSKILPELLLVVGVILVTVSTSHRILRARSLAVSETVVTQYLTEVSASEPETAPVYPTHITIPWYVDIPIDPHVYQDGQWSVSENHASYLTTSASPGSPGNIIIYGHNKRGIMGNIRALKGYETITLALSDGTTRDYQVESIQEVAPTRTELLSPTSEETLTLYTCSGFLDSQRFVVRAVPKSN